ncbi:hypothetical protein AYL99_04150 [Fonsecaea erecta]|uniref:non-specific serine/threonine protein kinase n=1 Tax=Fonsecaea erecta TaxID=1367422 RepID=A0A178ZQ81_9EURO|nr:hypothetical protein AYL99_04150 [Fonsecaea erecta]OAP61947.1 hypothetical protein AYL99_04150 [Fonsecaea erecta]
MTLVTALSRKRRPASPPLPLSARRATPPLSKIQKLNHLFDGTGSRSMESTSTGRSKISVRSQLRRGVSTIKTVLGLGDRCSDSSVEHNTESMFPLTQGNNSVYFLANESAMTLIHQPLRLRLTAIADSPEEDGDTSASPTTMSAPISPGSLDVAENEDDNPYDSLSTNSRREIFRSQSAPGLQRRISQKFHQTFGNGNSTVIKRSDLRSRPSVQTLLQESAVASATPFSSTLSTFNSSTFSSVRRDASTPPTSEPVTPSTIVHRGSVDSCDMNHQTFAGECRLLSPIPESFSFPFVTIKTVEAAATTRIFLELHFNSLLNCSSPREIRANELEMRMHQLRLPSDLRDRARKAWEVAESENLRQHRVLKNTTNQAKASQGVSVGGFEVINVLGKGSFGVVRLVKVKNSRDGLQTPETNGANKILINVPSLSNLMSPGRVLSGGFFNNKRRDIIKARKDVYAMKVIRKSDMIRNGQEGHLRAERDFLVAAEGSKWVIPLIAAFQDRKHLYLVMEYCIGGDFLGLLIRKNVLSEEFTKFYIAEMILCVEEAHRMRWIHRDVKPDNFLIAYDGHLKISDFGLAFDGDWSHDQRFYQKNRHSLLDDLGIVVDGDEQDKQEKDDHAIKKHGKEDSTHKEEPAPGEAILEWRNRSQRRRLARSVVGTSQYMAPEWSIAIIMYECLFGFTPFACDDRHQTKLKILQHKKTLVFPRGDDASVPSIEALDLMMQILVEKEKRLCSRQYEHNDFTRKVVGGRLVRCATDKAHQNYQGYFVYPGDAEDIKRHAWFIDIDWDTLNRQRPPYQPRIRDWEDTKYFDDEEPISDIDSATTLDDSGLVVGAETAAPNPNAKHKTTQLSHHHAEGQNIIPSAAMNLPPKDPLGPGRIHVAAEHVDGLKNPLMQPRLNGCPTTGATLVGTGLPVESPLATVSTENPKPKARKKEMKRPRDIILRDPVTGPPALETRKLGAFMGYEYRQPTMVPDILEQVLAEEMEGNKIKLYRQACDQNDPDLTYEKRAFMEHGGQLSPRHQAGLM